MELLRFQLGALSRWYEEKVGHGSSRLRRIGIVALARRLLIELWLYLETGTLREGHGHECRNRSSP